MFRSWVAYMWLATALSGASIPDERAVIIEPFDRIPLNSEIVVTISGWPDTCLEVDLDFISREPGGVDVQAGTFELSNGATQATVSAPEPAEYGLRVSGTSPECGDPFFSPDFFVLANGDIDIEIDDDEATLTASNWSPDCSTIDVIWSGPWAEEGIDPDENTEFPGVEPTDWQWGEIALTDGSGTATGAVPQVLDFRSYWEITIAGNPERCGPFLRKEVWLDEPSEPAPPITMATTPGPTVPTEPSEPVLSANASCRVDDGIINLTIHDPELGSYEVHFGSEQFEFWEFVDVTESTPIVFSFGPIPNGRYFVVVDDERTVEVLITSVTVTCPAAPLSSTTPSPTATPTSAPQSSTPITLPTTGPTGQTDASLILTALLLVTSGSVLLVTRRR